MSISSRRPVSKSLIKDGSDQQQQAANPPVPEFNTISSALPKHIPFPYIEDQSDFLMEGFSFVVGLFAMGCQYLEMYRTVWWLPEFANKKALHFHLIDRVVLAFVVVILARKFLALFVLASVRYLKKRHKSYLSNYIPHLYVVQIACLLGVCSFDVCLQYGILNLLCLCYP